jgi:hypothetical protein
MLAELLSQFGLDAPPVSVNSGVLRPPSQYYKFARGGLCLTCDDAHFAERFRFLFAECTSSQEELNGLQIFFLELTTNHISNTSLITFDAKESVDYPTFIRELFPERNLRVLPDKKLAKWRCLAPSDATEPVIAVGMGRMLVDRDYAWQAVVAQFAVSNVMRLQQDVWFFHAASLGIDKSGVLILGAKGSGKTTLSLAFAARSHAFLGDEYAAVWVRAGAILPFRRAVSIRPGVCAARLEARLQEMNPLIDKTQDGLNRVRLSVRDVFPDAPSCSVSLSHCFFLRSFKREPAVVEFAPGESGLPLLQPLVASLWCQRSGISTLEFLRTFSKARCFLVDVGGTADETAELIERVVEGK